MAEWKLANGEVLSDTDFDIEAETWENDTWAGKLEGVRIGRRPLCDEPLKQINVKLPESLVAAIDVRTTNRSDFIRKAIAAYL